MITLRLNFSTKNGLTIIPLTNRKTSQPEYVTAMQIGVLVETVMTDPDFLTPEQKDLLGKIVVGRTGGTIG